MNYTFDTAQKTMLEFKPTHFLVSGKITLKEQEQAQKIKLMVLFVNDSRDAEELKLRKAGDTVYTWEYYSPVDRKLVIEPQITGEGANLLFYPQRKVVEVEDECVRDIVFEAKTGLMITGRIEPPTPDVKIRILNRKTSQEVITVLTDASGHYKVGPLYDDQQYDVEASLEDYLFQSIANTTSFKA